VACEITPHNPVAPGVAVSLLPAVSRARCPRAGQGPERLVELTKTAGFEAIAPKGENGWIYLELKRAG
jgi:hypothetical protein